MARGRMLNRRISTSIQFHRLPDDTARLLATWLIPHLDCRGVFFGDAPVVKSYIFPRRADVSSEQVEGYLQAMAALGLIVLFEADGQRWQFWPGFSRNQTGLRPDREKTDYPPPPKNAVLAAKHPDPAAGNGLPALLPALPPALPGECRPAAGQNPSEEKIKEKEKEKEKGKEALSPAAPAPPSPPPEASPPLLSFSESQKRELPNRPDGAPAIKALALSLAEVCRLDPQLISRPALARLNEATRRLAAAGATPEQVRAFGAYWWAADWRALKNNSPPGPEQVCDEWVKFMGQTHAPTRSVGEGAVDGAPVLLSRESSPVRIGPHAARVAAALLAKSRSHCPNPG